MTANWVWAQPKPDVCFWRQTGRMISICMGSWSVTICLAIWSGPNLKRAKFLLNPNGMREVWGTPTNRGLLLRFPLKPPQRNGTLKQSCPNEGGEFVKLHTDTLHVPEATQPAPGNHLEGFMTCPSIRFA